MYQDYVIRRTLYFKRRAQICVKTAEHARSSERRDVHIEGAGVLHFAHRQAEIYIFNHWNICHYWSAASLRIYNVT